MEHLALVESQNHNAGNARLDNEEYAMAILSIRFLRSMLLVLMAWGAECPAALADNLVADDLSQIKTWLSTHRDYRLAQLEDCDCAESIDLLRKGDGPAWKPQPHYQPYYARGDFDGDGVRDFAVVVRPIATESGAQVLVFLHGIKGEKLNPHVYRLKDSSLRNIGLFLGRSNGRAPTRLLVGSFGSEAEVIALPKAKK